MRKDSAAAELDFTAVKHSAKWAPGILMPVTQTIKSGKSSTTMLTGLTKEAQFEQGEPALCMA